MPEITITNIEYLIKYHAQCTYSHELTTADYNRSMRAFTITALERYLQHLIATPAGPREPQ